VDRLNSSVAIAAGEL